jgi:excisionase family DNA binding protein
MKQQEDKIMTAVEAASATGIRQHTLYRLAREGRIGHIKISSRRMGFLQRHLDSFLKEREFKPETRLV